MSVNSEWTEVVQKNNYSSLAFDYRVICKKHYYGSGCEKLCRPRNDKFGHYTCDLNGDPVCEPGWNGEDYCTNREYYCT